MSGYLIDTNVLSEAMKPRPQPEVIAWLAGVEDACLSVVTLHELTYGIALLPPGKRRKALEKTLAELQGDYGDRIIPVGRSEANEAARLRLRAKLDGRVLHLADALIGATANANGLVLATRNSGDFVGLGVRLFDPWLGMEA